MNIFYILFLGVFNTQNTALVTALNVGGATTGTCKYSGLFTSQQWRMLPWTADTSLHGLPSHNWSWLLKT